MFGAEDASYGFHYLCRYDKKMFLGVQRPYLLCAADRPTEQRGAEPTVGNTLYQGMRINHLGADY